MSLMYVKCVGSRALPGSRWILEGRIGRREKDRKRA